MVNTLKITISLRPFESWFADLLTGQLAGEGFDTFVETENGFEAYIPENKFDDSCLQRLSERSADQFDIQFRMIDMHDLERALAVTRRGLRQFPIEGLFLISGARALSLAGLRFLRTLPHRRAKGFVTGRSNPLFFTRALKGGVDGKDIFLLERLVIFADEFVEQRLDRKSVV